MGATDAGVAAIMKRVIRHIMSAEVAPDLFFRPVSDGVDFHQPELGVPLDLERDDSSGSLVAADARDPCGQLAELLPERFDLP